jgi:CubicO group peptidase (beta-lactamase class C family)
MNTCGKQRAPLPVRKPKQTGVALRHAATRNVIIAETVVNNFDKTKMNSRFFILFLIIFISGRINSQEQGQELRVYLDSLIPKYFNFQSEGPGVAVAVSLNGELLTSKEFGLANLEHNSPITTETKFHLTSGSKQFTAYAILKLEQQNLLSLDDEIHQYLPELKDFGHPITIKHLLTHTSGIRQDTQLEHITGYWKGQVMTQSRALELIYSQTELNFKPGTKFNYSNSGYTLLAEIIKTVTAEPFEIWMESNVFKPLGMNSTTITTDYSKIIPNYADSYDRNKSGFYKDSGNLWHFYGGTGVYSTSSDLMLWLGYLDNPSDNEKSIVALMEQQAMLSGNEQIVWGLGLIVNNDAKGRKKIWHSGDSPGYHSWIGRYPNEGLNLVVLSNLDSFQPEYLVEDITNYLFSETNSVYDSEEKKDENKDKWIPIEARVGWYKTSPTPIWYTSEYWKITESNNELYFHPDLNNKIKLIKNTNSEFKLENAPLRIVFHLDQQNNEVRLTLKGPEGNQYAKKISDEKYNFDIIASTEAEGIYYSPELKVEYEVFTENSKLKVRHNSPFINRRWNPFELYPIKKDKFISQRAFFSYVEFKRDSNNKVIGLRMTNRTERVQNLWFKKIN